MAQQENLLQHYVQNERIQKAIIESIADIFPIESDGKRLEIHNIRIEGKLNDWDFPKQRQFKMQRKSWHMPIYADMRITDAATGRLINKKQKTKIGNIPLLTNRFTMLIDGNEYQTVNQLRRKSGVYSRIKRNGELESEFNLAKGYNFKMMLNPITQVFVLILGNRKYRLWTLLNILGTPDSAISKIWGTKLLEINKKGALNTEVSEMTSIYKKVYRKDPANYNEVISGLNTYFKEYTEVDPETTKLTLGTSFSSVTPQLLLATSKKLLNINRNLAEPDDRDSLIYKRLYAVDDLLLSHFEKQKPVIARKLTRSLSLKDTIGEIISTSTFSKPIKEFFTTGDLSATPPQTNPVAIVDNWRKTTPMGTGGIQSRHSITMEARGLQPTHLGYLDALATPESAKVGVTVGLTSEVVKIGNDMATPVYNKKGKKIFIKPLAFFEAKIGYPDQFKMINGTPKASFPVVTAMHRGKVKRIKASEVDYYLRSPKTMFSFSSNLVPFLDNTQGNRASTGARMITQAMSLVDREAPLVQTLRDIKDKDKTYEQLLGGFLNPVLGTDDKGKEIKAGIVTKISNDYIEIKTTKGETVKRGLYKNFPLNQDGFLDSKPLVAVGDRITTWTPLADNNYTVKDTLALGKNLTVAYMSYKGYNFEDGAVITESAAKKMSHQMLHRINIFFSPKLTVLNLSKFRAWFPDVLTAANVQKMDERGLPKIGETFQPGEFLVAYLVEKEMDDVDRALKRLDKYTFSQYTKRTTEWDEDEPGIVTDVNIVGRNIDIYVKAIHPFKEGDKISGRHGNKYIVTKIIPDSEAPHRPNGEPVEIMLNPHGVPSRMNIGQILETAAGKIAKKTGEIFIIDNFEDPNDDVSKKVMEQMKDLGIEINEKLTDGKNGKEIDNPIFVGNQYFLKLRHIVKKKQGVHSYGTYDIDELPVGKGAQKVGIMETYAYLAHGAKANLAEIVQIKGRENEEYWRNLQLGLAPVPSKKNFIFDKMIAYLQGAGINVEKKGNRLQIMPLTDKQTLEMSNGEIKDPGALLIGKNLATRKEGLFDANVTGGIQGTHWAHIKLADRIPNPMYSDAIMKVLNLTEKQFNDIMIGEQKLNGKTGTKAIITALSNVQVKTEIKMLKKDLKIAPPTNVNKLNRRIRYLQALDSLKLSAKTAYTMQYVPILPPVFRPIYPLQTGDLMVSDINKHYRDIGTINMALKGAKDTLGPKELMEADYALFTSIKAMQGFIDPVNYSGEKYKGILQELSGKRAMVQGPAWSKRQDVSARSTITVEPSLGLDEVGLPKDMAYDMFKPFIIRELKEQGLRASVALKEYQDKAPLANNALQNVLKQRPVILNRAPSLHKHGVQAFKPILFKGKSIRLNPLIVSGFNADFDGDTMSVMTPIGPAAVEEAKHMMPSKILFKHGDNKLVPMLSQDYLYGLHELSLVTKKTTKSFKTFKEAKDSGIPWTHAFKLNGKVMTIGQYMINAKLPVSMRDYQRTMTGKVVRKLLTEIGKDRPSYFADVINAWKDLGSTYAHISGTTISILDFAIDRNYKNKLLKARLPGIEKLKGPKKIEALNKLTIDIQKAQAKAQSSTNNMYKMLNSGSFANANSVRQILSLPGVMKDIKGEPIEIPVTKSYAEGLDTAGYFTTLYSVRSTTTDRSVNTQDTGALNKTLLNVTRRVLITEEDCGTRKGLLLETEDKNVLDRFALETISGVIKRNSLIDSAMLLKLKMLKIKEIKVRSPLTCEAVQGICQLCYGLLPNGQIASIGTNVGVLESQAITERATQLTMQTFHTGGTMLGGGGMSAGFPRLTQLLKVPEKLSAKATLSTVKGTVKKLEKNLIGGYNVRIEGYGTENDENFIIPAGRLPIIKPGDKVDRGDPISDGVIKPQELGALKTHLDAQNYLVDEASNVYEGDFYRKTFETVIRGISDNAQITKAPDDSGFLRGDKTSISYLNRLNKERKKQGLEQIDYDPYFKSIDTLNTDVEDWFTKITSSRVKAALTTGAAKAQYANIRGRDPIPAYIYGEGFGKNIDAERGEFY